MASAEPTRSFDRAAVYRALARLFLPPTGASLILVRQELAELQRALARLELTRDDTKHLRAVLELEGVEPDRIALVPPGVDTEMFKPAEDESRNPDEFTILFVGWMLPRKGLYVLAEAVAHWLRIAPPERSVNVVVVSDGPGKQEIETLLRRLQIASRFRFMGAKTYKKMPEIYRGADLFVLPSIPTPTWEEQFGMSLLEAMASGVPCISTHSGAIPEVLGNAGLLVPPVDFVALSDAMQKLYADVELRSGLGQGGRTRAFERFSLERHVTEWRRVLENSAGG